MLDRPLSVSLYSSSAAGRASPGIGARRERVSVEDLRPYQPPRPISPSPSGGTASQISPLPFVF